MYCKPRDARKGISNRTTLNRSGRPPCGGHFFCPVRINPRTSQVLELQMDDFGVNQDLAWLAAVANGRAIRILPLPRVPTVLTYRRKGTFVLLVRCQFNWYLYHVL